MKIYVQLGLFGDCINILPLLYDDAQNGKRNALMLSKDFASLMDGVSYADKLIFDGPPWELDKALAQARSISDDVTVTQLIGPTEIVRQAVITRNGVEYRATTESFLKDQWNLAGRLGDWRKQIPLVFDLRDRQREENLIKQWLPKRKKHILVAAEGTSSPFEFKELLLLLIRLRFGRHYNIINLSSIKAERIYDLLALYEHPQTHCLVSIDSAPLHLAYAVPKLPVVALTNDRPSLWHGSAWRPNHVCHIRYHDFPTRANDMISKIGEIGDERCFTKRNDSPHIIHVWSEYEGAQTQYVSQRRVGEYIVNCPVEVGSVGHDSHNSRAKSLKDDKRFPFVKDVIRLAMLRAHDNDVICLTRSDCWFSDRVNPQTPTPSFSHRAIQDGDFTYYHPSTDLFLFTREWWRAHQSEYPDMIMGKDPYWHRVLKELMILHGGQSLPFAVFCNSKPKFDPVNPPPTPPYVTYNEQLASEFFKKHSIECAVPSVSKQVTLASFNRLSLNQWGYNPSIIEHGEGFLIAYRFHSDGTLATKLGLAECDKHFRVSNNSIVNVTGIGDQHSVEDPKLFYYGGQLYCSYIESNWPRNNPQCVVKYGRLINNAGRWEVVESFQVEYGKNDWSAMEKNWVFFEYESRLMCFYHSQPEQITLEVQKNKVVAEHRAPRIHWPWGYIHGGTRPIPYGEHLLRFFHTRMDNEPPPVRYRYYIGACLMKPTPPFEVLKISTEPIIHGSESDDLSVLERSSCLHWKSNVVFPSGCVRTNDGIFLSIGINDCISAIAKLSYFDLHL